MTRNNILSGIIIGLILWVSGVVFFRYTEAALFSDANMVLALVYLATIPFCWINIKLIMRFFAISPALICAWLCVGNATALVLDGTVLVWFPEIYSMTGEKTAFAGAWLLWAVAWLSASAFWESYKAQS